MNCCGKKRQQWAQEESLLQKPGSAAPILAAEEPIPEQPAALFRYKGYSPLILKGSRGRTYHFRFRNDEQEVAAEDVTRLLAIPGLEKIK